MTSNVSLDLQILRIGFVEKDDNHACESCWGPQHRLSLCGKR